MYGFSFKTNSKQDSGDGFRMPITDSGSKSVMLSAERDDNIRVDSIEEEFAVNEQVPDSLVVLQRVNTYFGPKLLTTDSEGNHYLLTAPGPESFLILWGEHKSKTGNRESWFRQAEIRASLSDDVKKYHLCPECGEPIKSSDHIRLAAIGQCPYE